MFDHSFDLETSMSLFGLWKLSFCWHFPSHDLCLMGVIQNQLQKQSELLLNADDLDAMWVCLRENCVIDDATGAEKVLLFAHT